MEHSPILSSSGHKAMVLSAKLRNLVESDEGGALLVDDHVKDPYPLSPSPLPRVNGQFFQIDATPPPQGSKLLCGHGYSSTVNRNFGF